MLDVVAQRVDDDRLGQRQLGGVVDVEGEDGVGAVLTDDAGELQGGQRQVARVGAVTVEDRGDLAGATGATRGALAELGAWFDGQTYLGHGLALLATKNMWGKHAATGGISVRFSVAAANST